VSAATAPPRASGRLIGWLLLALTGLGLAIAFHAGFALPLRTGVVVLGAASTWAILRVRVTRLSLLPRFMLLAYSLPFSVLVGYLLNPAFTWHYTERGRNVLSDPMVVRQMITVGLVGLLGLLAGMRWAALRPPRGSTTPETAERRPTRALADPVFYVLLPIAFAFSWISAPPETIFQAVYASGQSEAVSTQINFPAAYMLSYILLVILAIDAERERSARRRLVKVLALGVVVGYIVIVLQVLRGDRESAGLVVALVGIYLTSTAGLRAGERLAEVSRRRMRRLLVPLVAMVALFVALGALRSRLSQASAVAQVLTPTQAVELGLSQNTWTAVLWTNLSLAWEYRQGDLLHYKYGQTYLDYLLSLPPGVVTHALGYERPMEAWRGIGWEDAAKIAVGGLHPVVAPFRNFGAFGVFFILMLYGFLIARVEQRGASGTLWGRVLWGSVFCAGFNWFWYGDMPFIRALMFAGILYVVYRVALSVRWTSPRLNAEGVPAATRAPA
jgi:hypothetical protein